MTRLVPVAIAIAVLTACNGAIGNTLAGSTDRLVMPYVMRSGDIGVGCAVGEGLGPMVGAFNDASHHAAKTSIVSTLSAGMCLEDDVWEAQLDTARALRREDTEGAHDASERAQRAHAVAARRYLAAWTLLADEYGVPEPGGECPKLKKDTDQLIYMLGLSAGVLAVVHDMGAGGQADVPMSIPAGVVRASACLDDDTWWGAPNAMKAAVWALMEGSPDVGDPWALFDQSVAKGQAAGVRLAGAFLAQTASSTGHEAQLRAAVKSHAASLAAKPLDPKWAMLDRYATAIVRNESDRIWTAKVGYRTPSDGFGTFPDDVTVDDAKVDDSLFDDILK